MFTGKISNDTDFCNDKYVSLLLLSGKTQKSTKIIPEAL